MDKKSRKMLAKKKAKEKVVKRFIYNKKTGEGHWELYPFWTTDPSKIKNLGEGVILFYKFLKRAINFYLIMTILAAIMVLLNYFQTGGDDFNINTSVDSEINVNI